MCTEAGRDPYGMVYSVADVSRVGRGEADLKRRAAAIGRTPDELVEQGYGRTVVQVVDKLGRFAQAGASRAYLQVLDMSDLDHLELIASWVMP